MRAAITVILAAVSLLLLPLDYATQPQGITSAVMFTVLVAASALIFLRTRKPLALVFEGVFVLWAILWFLIGTLTHNVSQLSWAQALILAAALLVPLIGSYILFRPMWIEQYKEQKRRMFGDRS